MRKALLFLIGICFLGSFFGCEDLPGTDRLPPDQTGNSGNVPGMPAATPGSSFDNGNRPDQPPMPGY